MKKRVHRTSTCDRDVPIHSREHACTQNTTLQNASKYCLQFFLVYFFCFFGGGFFLLCESKHFEYFELISKSECPSASFEDPDSVFATTVIF